MKGRIHLDHNATTPLRPEARARWLEVVDRLEGNPSALHAGGRAARDVLDRARAQVAAALGAHEEEVVFTSGGTESNRLALLGAFAGRGSGGLVTSAVEHASVLGVAERLERDGIGVVRLPVDASGSPDLAALDRALERPTRAVSIQAANNEVGALPPLGAIADRLRASAEERPLFHTDAVQALGRIPLELGEDGWGVDVASFSAHKVGGPVGVGVLWRRRGARLLGTTPHVAQEGGLRPGTEDVAGIAAAAVAIELAVAEQPAFAERTSALARGLWCTLESRVPGVRLYGPAVDAARLPNTLCIAFPDTDGKVLVTRLDLEGLEVSAGSACASGSIEPSHVLRAMGCDDAAARAGLRVSLGRATTRAECDAAVDILRQVFGAARATRRSAGTL